MSILSLKNNTTKQVLVADYADWQESSRDEDNFFMLCIKNTNTKIDKTLF